MSRALHFILLVSSISASCAAADALPGPWIGIDNFISTDADGTDVVKLGANLDWQHADPQKYAGIRVEQFRLRSRGRGWQQDQRIYLRLADTTGRWTWSTLAGTDGHTLLGTASINNNSAWRQEYFIERDIVESPQGISRGIYYTFVGGALDLPISDADSATIVAGVQDFTGKNVRVHLRANYVHMLDSQRGITAQLRARYFHSSEPNEFDYFSPRYYLEVLPVLQLRRTSASGWRYLLAGGYGARRDATSRWGAARYVNARLTSPSRPHGVSFNLALTYSNTPVGSGSTYHYTQLMVGVSRAF